MNLRVDREGVAARFLAIADDAVGLQDRIKFKTWKIRNDLYSSFTADIAHLYLIYY